MRRRPGAAAVCIVAGTALFLVAACGTSPAPAAPAARGGEPMPADVQVLPHASLSAGTVGTNQTCHPTESLRPSGPLPRPGRMPAGSTMAAIYQRGKLVVGVDQTTFLFGYRNPLTGQLEGFDIDIARAIAQAIFGRSDRIEFRAITSAQRIPYVQQGLVDIVADSMTITCAREQYVDFSTDYFNAGQKVLVPSNSPVRGIADLGGRKVCSAAGTTSIQTIAAQPSHPIPVTAPNWTDCLVLLQQNQVAAISTDDSVLAGLAIQDPQTKLVGPQFTREPHGLAISKKAPDFVRFGNAVLQQLRTDGGWTALYRKWIGTRLGAIPPPPPASYRS